jgi:hypothetical protein
MTTAALSPLQKQGDVSKDPTAPTAVPPQASSTPPTATTSHEQGAKTSPAATTACTLGSSSSLLDTLVHCYTPIVHLGPLLTPIKGRSRALVREGWPRGRTGRRTRLPLSLSHADACNPPTASAPDLGAGQHEGRGFPLSRFSPFVLRPAPTHLGWDTRRQFTRRSRDPPGSKRRHVRAWICLCLVGIYPADPTFLCFYAPNPET